MHIFSNKFEIKKKTQNRSDENLRNSKTKIKLVPKKKKKIKIKLDNQINERKIKRKNKIKLQINIKIYRWIPLLSLFFNQRKKICVSKNPCLNEVQLKNQTN